MLQWNLLPRPLTKVSTEFSNKQAERLRVGLIDTQSSRMHIELRG